MGSDHNGMKLEVNYMKKQLEKHNTWGLKQTNKQTNGSMKKIKEKI